jgi:hypothetical protein
MEMNIREALFVISSAIALPVVTVLTISFFTGGLKRTEDARYLPVLEEDVDWWTSTGEPQGGRSS